MRRVRILMYHRVEYLNDDYNMQAVTPANFEKHMRYLRDHYEILRLDVPIESWFKNQSKDAVIVTFDDGYYFKMRFLLWKSMIFRQLFLYLRAI